MRLEIKNFNGNLADKMRSAGYHYDGQDPKSGEMRFYKSLSSGLYPRFHIYCLFDKAKKMLAVNLHLDQKAPVYEGAAAHSGDDGGEVVSREAERLKADLLPRPPMASSEPLI